MARSTRHAALIDALVMRLGAWRNAHRPPDVAPDPQGRTWYRIENKTDAASAVLHLYDEIGAWGVSADAFMTDLAELGSRDLVLRINSPGGEVFDGVAIFNALQRHGGRITGHVDGLAASAASFIAMAADELVMEPGTQMMIHDAQGMCWGDEAGALELAKMLGRTSNTIAMIYAERAGGTADEWRERMRATTWYEGAEAVDAGLADRVGESRQRDAGTGQKTPDNRVGAGQTNYDEGQARDPHSGRWSDGMPDAIASYTFATTSGALTSTRTREGVELSDGAHTVSLRPHEQARLIRAMGNSYGESDTTITRHTERDGAVFSVVIARVRPQGREDSNGEPVAAGMRLDIGEVDDPDDYDTRTGVMFSVKQADEPFATALDNAASAARVETGYGPLDMYPSATGGMGLRMKGDDGRPTEVEFSAAEWKRINAAMDAVLDGYDHDTDQDADKITVTTKAGKVDVEHKGPRDDSGYHPDSRLTITPQDGAAGWSVVIGGEHMSAAFEPLGNINDAIGVHNVWSPRMRRRPAVRPRNVVIPAAWAAPLDYDADQLRGDDGKWAAVPGAGLTSWEDYGNAFDVLDEVSTSNGLVTTVLTDGRVQLGFDDAETGDGRYVLWTTEPDEFDGLDDALSEVLDGPVGTETAVGSASTYGNALTITRIEVDGFDAVQLDVTAISRPGYKEERLELQIDLDEAYELLNNVRRTTLAGQQRYAPEDTWTGLVSGFIDSDVWTQPEWATAHSTPEPVSSPPADDHQAFWEAWV